MSARFCETLTFRMCCMEACLKMSVAACSRAFIPHRRRQWPGVGYSVKPWCNCVQKEELHVHQGRWDPSPNHNIAALLLYLFLQWVKWESTSISFLIQLLLRTWRLIIWGSQTLWCYICAQVFNLFKVIFNSNRSGALTSALLDFLS